MPTVQEIIQRLQGWANPANVSGMERFGINPNGTLGISIYTLRPLAKEIGVNHALAQELWQSGIHEARILAGYIDDPNQVDEAQLEAWVMDFDSWDVCDQVCSNLFDRTPYAWEKAVAWSEREAEFVKRSGFVLMAALASHAKNTPDKRFEAFLGIILREACDERNFVKKAVNWALRGIGKRSLYLNGLAIEVAQRMAEIPCRAARWNAKDALRELKSDKVQEKLIRKRQT